jgi:hypothetical protein
MFKWYKNYLAKEAAAILKSSSVMVEASATKAPNPTPGKI